MVHFRATPKQFRHFDHHGRHLPGNTQLWNQYGFHMLSNATIRISTKLSDIITSSFLFDATSAMLLCKLVQYAVVKIRTSKQRLQQWNAISFWSLQIFRGAHHIYILLPIHFLDGSYSIRTCTYVFHVYRYLEVFQYNPVWCSQKMYLLCSTLNIQEISWFPIFHIGMLHIL